MSSGVQLTTDARAHERPKSNNYKDNKFTPHLQRKLSLLQLDSRVENPSDTSRRTAGVLSAAMYPRIVFGKGSRKSFGETFLN